MYRLYLQFCSERQINSQQIAKIWLFRDIFNKRFDLSFKPPETDTCGPFTAQMKNNTSQLDRGKLQTEYNLHLCESKTRYDLKSNNTKFKTKF